MKIKLESYTPPDWDAKDYVLVFDFEDNHDMLAISIRCPRKGTRETSLKDIKAACQSLIEAIDKNIGKPVPENQCVCCRNVSEKGAYSSDGEFFCDPCCDKLATEWEVESD